jgi:hypothetical protein
VVVLRVGGYSIACSGVANREIERGRRERGSLKEFKRPEMAEVQRVVVNESKTCESCRVQ